MTATVAPLIKQILACSTEDRKAVFLRLATEMLKQEPHNRPTPLTNEKGECVGVYWPVFVSPRTTPPEIPPAHQAELLRRHATLDDAEDWDELLKD